MQARNLNLRGRTMRRLESIVALCCAAALSACVYVNETTSDVSSTYREANLEGSSYKAMLPNDPTFQSVAEIATAAAYEAGPTRALVEQVSVLQAANGDYVAHVTMTGGDMGQKYRLVVVELTSEGDFVSKGVILH